MSRFDKLDELLNKFENGHERYRESVLFYKTVDALLHGNDPLFLIDQLIKMNEECQTKLRNAVLQIPLHYIIKPETDEKK